MRNPKKLECLCCRKTTGGKNALHEKLDAVLETMHKDAGNPHGRLRVACTARRFLGVAVTLLTTLSRMQDAGKDLKNKLNERPQQEDEKPSKMPRTRDGKATASDSTRSITNEPPDVPAPDPEWSSPAPESEDEGSGADDQLEASSDDEDQDVFGGKYAIKDKDVVSTSGCRDDRFGNLPRNAAKYLDNFEEDVLNSIPNDVSELRV